MVYSPLICSTVRSSSPPVDIFHYCLVCLFMYVLACWHPIGVHADLVQHFWRSTLLRTTYISTKHCTISNCPVSRSAHISNPLKWFNDPLGGTVPIFTPFGKDLANMWDRRFSGAWGCSLARFSYYKFAGMCNVHISDFNVQTWYKLIGKRRPLSSRNFKRAKRLGTEIFSKKNFRRYNNAIAVPSRLGDMVHLA